MVNAERLSLAQEAMLLHARSTRSPGGTMLVDSFAFSPEADGLAIGSVLMELVIGGFLQSSRPYAPAQRWLARLRGRLASYGAILVFLCFWLFLVQQTNWRPFDKPITAIAFFASIALIPISMIAIVFMRDRTARAFLAFASTPPGGDPVLAQAFQTLASARRGARLPVNECFRLLGASSWWRGGRGKQRLIGPLPAQLCAQLETSGYLRSTNLSPRVLGFVRYYQVWRDGPAFVALSERIRSLIPAGGVPDARTVALALLFWPANRIRSFGRTQTVYGLQQFFTYEDMPLLRTRLAHIYHGDDTGVVAQLGGDLYDTLLAIAYGAEDYVSARNRAND